MNSFFRSIILLVIIAWLPFNALGQGKRAPKGKNFKFRVSNRFKVLETVSIFGSLGAANYYGDLCDNFRCMQFRPAVGGGLIYRLSDKVSSKSELSYIRLYSKDVWPDRNLSFRSGNVEIYTSVMYDYYPFTKNLRFRKLLSPYIFLGVGLTYYNPRAKLDGKWYSLRPLQTEGVKYGSITPIIPFGFGVKIRHSRNWDFLAEAGYRKTFSDYLDDVSSYNFKKQNEFTNEEAASLANRTVEGDNFKGYRGNPKRDDGYIVISLKARYTFTSKHVYRNKYSEQHRKIF